MATPFLVEPVTLELQHIRLEPLEMHHFDSLVEYAAEPELWSFMGSGNLAEPEQLRATIERWCAEQVQGKGLMFAIVPVAHGRSVGMTGLYDIQPNNRSLELGRTWLGKPFRRTTINTEAKYLLLRHCFETLGANRVTIKTDARNERSQRAIERIGATREGVLRYHMVLWNGFVRDTVYYSVIAPEWQQVKARLESLLDGYNAQTG